jgi:prevent-host-death family protein
MGKRGGKIYSTYDAKARFSEMLKRVRAGESVRISYHGQTVAELRPVHETGIDRRLAAMEEEGIIERSTAPTGRLEPIARRPGALARFLEARE